MIIINYNMGNCKSVSNIIKHISNNSIIPEITREPEKIIKASKIILPGVGSFDSGMQNLKKYNLVEPLNLAFNRGSYILGICLGMQLMTLKSEEGHLDGLGWFNAETLKFSFKDEELKIPHMGWNNIEINQPNHLNESLDKSSRFYFIHSYYVKCKDDSDQMLTTQYGFKFCSGISRGNLYGVQFHPEKSHKFGMIMMKNFIRM